MRDVYLRACKKPCVGGSMCLGRSRQLTTTFQSGQFVLVGQTRGVIFSLYIEIHLAARDVRTNDITSLLRQTVFIFKPRAPAPLYMRIRYPLFLKYRAPILKTFTTVKIYFHSQFTCLYYTSIVYIYMCIHIYIAADILYIT